MQYTHVPLRQRNAAFAACTVCETGYQIKGSENLTPEQENTQQHKKNILTSIDHPSAIHCQFSEHTHTRAPPRLHDTRMEIHTRHTVDHFLFSMW